ncbi:hypothetical protein D3C81_973170 [compost metagenome]
MRHIVDDVDIQRTTGHITIGVADQDADTLALCIGPSAVRMCLGVAQGVAVTDHTGRSIVTGDGQHVAQPGSDGLTHTGHSASRDDVDATDIQVEHTIRRHHSKTAGPGQGGGIAGRALDQVGFVEVQLTPVNLQTFDSDRVVDHRWQWRWQQRVIVVIEIADIQLWHFDKAVETRRRESDNRVNPTAHLTKHDKGMTTAERT